MGRLQDWRISRSGLSRDEFLDRRSQRWSKAKKILKPVKFVVGVFVPKGDKIVDIGEKLTEKIERENNGGTS